MTRSWLADSATFALLSLALVCLCIGLFARSADRVPDLGEEFRIRNHSLGVIRVNEEQRISIPLMNDSDTVQVFLRPQLSCGCVEVDLIEELLQPGMNSSMVITFAAVRQPGTRSWRVDLPTKQGERTFVQRFVITATIVNE